MTRYTGYVRHCNIQLQNGIQAWSNNWGMVLGFNLGAVFIYLFTYLAKASCFYFYQVCDTCTKSLNFV